MNQNKIDISEDVKRNGEKIKVIRYISHKNLLPTGRKIKILKKEPTYSIVKDITVYAFGANKPNHDQNNIETKTEPDENFIFTCYNNFYYDDNLEKEIHIKKKLIPYSKKYGAVGDYYIEYKHIDSVKKIDFTKYKEQDEFNNSVELQKLASNPLFNGLKKNLEVYCIQEYKIIAIYERVNNFEFNSMIDEKSWVEKFMGKYCTCPYLSCIVNIEYIGINENSMVLETRIKSIQFQSHRDRLEKIGNKMSLLYDYEKNFNLGIRPSTLLLSDGGNYNCGGAKTLLFIRLDKFNEYKKEFNKNVVDYTV